VRACVYVHVHVCVFYALLFWFLVRFIVVLDITTCVVVVVGGGGGYDVVVAVVTLQHGRIPI
jgi:hypothetical protein